MRYCTACGGDTRKAMTLYRRNLTLSQEFFTVISVFEVSIRNCIDNELIASLGGDWLRNGVQLGGVFDHPNCRFSRDAIQEGIRKLNLHYSHNKLVAELGFGFWRFMFADHQFKSTGSTLLRIFPSRPKSSPSLQYNQKYVFNQLAVINNLRNRIAHHEPICFVPGNSIISTAEIRQKYALILQFFQWMNIDEGKLLYGIDHIISVCDQIDSL